QPAQGIGVGMEDEGVAVARDEQLIAVAAVAADRRRVGVHPDVAVKDERAVLEDLEEAAAAHRPAAALFAVERAPRAVAEHDEGREARRGREPAARFRRATRDLGVPVDGALGVDRTGGDAVGRTDKTWVSDHQRFSVRGWPTCESGMRPSPAREAKRFALSRLRGSNFACTDRTLLGCNGMNWLCRPPRSLISRTSIKS